MGHKLVFAFFGKLATLQHPFLPLWPVTCHCWVVASLALRSTACRAGVLHRWPLASPRILRLPRTLCAASIAPELNDDFETERMGDLAVFGASGFGWLLRVFVVVLVVVLVCGLVWSGLDPCASNRFTLSVETHRDLCP